MAMIGLEPGTVQLLPHQTAWHELFEDEKQRLQVAIGEFVLDIQHVGSTAIPNIPAKPIIDIGVAVHNFEEAAVCIPLVEALGYNYRGENGIPRRHYFNKGNPRTHHLHINEIAGENWANQVLFRDYLRENSQLAQAYAQFKLELAKQFPTEREQYSKKKDPFIEEILRFARVWNLGIKGSGSLT